MRPLVPGVYWSQTLSKYINENIIAKHVKFYEEKRQLCRERITWVLSKAPIKKSDNWAEI